jgi:hypothetical protein
VNKKVLKRWYYTLLFSLTRSDVCPKHWVTKDRRGYTAEPNMDGRIVAVHTISCGLCEDERTAAEEKARQDSEERREQQQREFEESLAKLREAYL